MTPPGLEPGPAAPGGLPVRSGCLLPPLVCSRRLLFQPPLTLRYAPGGSGAASRCRPLLSVGAACVALAAGACGGPEPEPLDPGALKKDGTRSQEFASEHLDRAEQASEAVRKYCSGAVSESQDLGCLSYLTDDDLP